MPLRWLGMHSAILETHSLTGWLAWGKAALADNGLLISYQKGDQGWTLFTVLPPAGFRCPLSSTVCPACCVHCTKRMCSKIQAFCLLWGKAFVFPVFPEKNTKQMGKKNMLCITNMNEKYLGIHNFLEAGKKLCNIQSDRWCLLWDMGGSVYKDKICRKKCEGQNWWAKLWPAFFS